MKWLAQSTIYRDSIDLLAVIDYGDGRDIGLPMQITMAKHERNTVITEPTLALGQDSAKSLMQALWDAGIRPRELSNPNGEINALRSHVEFAEEVAKKLLAAYAINPSP
jgi:hypothetical protein